MVEYKVLRVTDNEGSISVVVQVPSVNKIVPICFNSQSFKQMTEEEIEYSTSQMIEQMFGGQELQTMPGANIQVSKVEKMHKYFNVDDPDRKLIDSQSIRLIKPKIDTSTMNMSMVPPLDLKKIKDDKEKEAIVKQV